MNIMTSNTVAAGAVAKTTGKPAPGIPDAPKASVSKKIDSIQILRGLAALSVVFYHLVLVEKKYAGSNSYLPDILLTGRSGVDLFFVISGFIMVLITRKKWGQKTGTIDFLLHRFARIYPNYWFYFFITLGVFLVQPSFVNASQAGRFNFWSSLLLFPSTSLPLVMVAWSLIYELYFYLVFSLLMRCRESFVIRILFGWLVLLVILNCFSAGIHPGPVGTVMMSPYSIEFILGAFAAILVAHPRVRQLSEGLLAGIIIVSAVAVPLLFPKIYTDGKFYGTKMLCQTLLYGIIFAAVVVAMAVLEAKKEIKFWRWLVMLGDISFTVYLSQLLVIGAIGRLWAALAMKPDTWVDNAIALTAMIAAIIIYSNIAYRVIEKPSYNLIIRWIKGKKGKMVVHG